MAPPGRRTRSSGRGTEGAWSSGGGQVARPTEACEITEDSGFHPHTPGQPLKGGKEGHGHLCGHACVFR